MTANRARSIRARLLNLAKSRGDDFNLVLMRYALERWLYRLSISAEADSFVLKGALLFSVWFEKLNRPTRDADFLGYGSSDAASVRTRLQAVCTLPCDDGMDYDAESVTVTATREEARYAGLHAEILATLDTARSVVRLDVGFGDVVTPAPRKQDYPTLLPDVPGPRLRVYPRETVVAEKFEAIITLGMRNSRLKDYFDLWTLLGDGSLDQHLLAEAIAATCARRETALPAGMPMGLTGQFAQDGAKQAQWKAFLDRNRMNAPPLPAVVETVSRSLVTPLKLARDVAS